MNHNLLKTASRSLFSNRNNDDSLHTNTINSKFFKNRVNSNSQSKSNNNLNPVYSFTLNKKLNQ